MAKRTKPAAAPKRRSASETPLIARVNLVPHEYYTELKERKILRMLGLVVIGILLIGVAGSFGVGYLAKEAQQAFVAEQERGAALRAERAEYAELTGVLAELETAKAAQTVALYAEVDWNRIVSEFQAALPGDSARMTELNLAQRLAPGVGGSGFTDTSDSNPLSELTPVFVEYRFTSPDEQAGNQLLDRLVSHMTGYDWANQINAQLDGGGGYTFSGVIRLGMPAIGSDRANAIDEVQLTELREAFGVASTDRDAAARGAR